jgi:hypothetical protein
VALCSGAEGSLGAGCATAEENAVGWCHRRMIPANLGISIAQFIFVTATNARAGSVPCR